MLSVGRSSAVLAFLLLSAAPACAGAPRGAAKGPLPSAQSSTPALLATTSTPPAVTAEPLAVAPELPPLPTTTLTPAVLAPAQAEILIADELPEVASGGGRGHGAASPKKPKHGRVRHPKHPPKGAHGHANPGRGPHPDPGIIVDVSPVEGASQAEIQRIARAKGYGVFRTCYEIGLRRDQVIRGRVSIDFTLAKDGTVSQARRTASTVGDESVNQCVVRELTMLTFVNPTRGEPTVSMQVTLWPGDAPVFVPKPVRHAEPLRVALRAKWGAVEGCYRKGLDRRRNLGGMLTLHFQLKPSGVIANVTEADSHFGDPEVTQCVASVYRSMKLPDLHGRAASFVYPLELESIATAAPVTRSAGAQ